MKLLALLPFAFLAVSMAQMSPHVPSDWLTPEFVDDESSTASVCLHQLDLVDHKCDEACTSKKFEAVGYNLQGKCPSDYNTVDQTKTIKQCADGRTNIRYCTDSVNVTFVTRGEKSVQASAPVQDVYKIFDQCMDTKCAAQSSACLADQKCATSLACLKKCTHGDHSCTIKCSTNAIEGGLNRIMLNFGICAQKQSCIAIQTNHETFQRTVRMADLELPQPQLSALMSLYTSTNGAGWKNNAGWGTSQDFCTWYGVECNHDPPGTSQLTMISLENNGLKGSIPEAIFDSLPDLKVFELNNNEITGAVPTNLAKLKKLRLVHLGHNQLTGSIPATMMNLEVDYPAMQEIDLSYNKLTGEIPTTLFGPDTPAPFAPVVSLKVLNLRENMVTGSLPENMKNDKALISMLVGGNKMSGAVSSTLGDFLSELKYCDMSGSVWKCPLPSKVAAVCQAICA